jgi:hypothetical protein
MVREAGRKKKKVKREFSPVFQGLPGSNIWMILFLGINPQAKNSTSTFATGRPAAVD